MKKTLNKTFAIPILLVLCSCSGGNGTYQVSYTLRSTWLNGEKTFAEVTEAALSRNLDGSFNVLAEGCEI